ncbi:heat-inducible transcription repressor HrcA [Syntrophobotulus glycolicus DSM 8271]|uniref:Heat-inducible transcription repressor HrcA n=1 Tax=Syntrophobotulus glycolicus (strain DSM 8271 / FlGlyR) TaxID=645991 RepID=F0SVF1_SYNGF|nr:heat-inducible transcriptional repressor HrcA [Syntrophobotulus glycolicus]ADY56724.1 heat-inducible transcription repressor HrcA [Syntrophobotulus glycolicus DSM 8271]
MGMDERKQKILRAIIQDYIATAEPVGSRTISRKFDLGVSPATIRNEMADLEDMGFIEQPHTSAGRVPSDSGYRYYVDYLLEPLSLTTEDKDRINHEISGRINEVEEVIEYTGKLISQITSLTSLVLGPKRKNKALKKIYFLPYEEGKAIMVTVKDNGTVENDLIDLDEDTSLEDLQMLANLFNEKISGAPVSNLKQGILQEIYSALSQKRRMIDSMLGILERTLVDEKEGPKDRVYLGGTLNMLNQPEFQDMDKLRSLFGVFEENKKLKTLLKQDQEGVQISIGLENEEQILRNCSIISATYHINGRQIGSIGVLGPTRMDYQKTITIVDYMTHYLTELLTEGHR